MDISVKLLPSGGYGYDFPTVQVKPMTFIEICDYMSNLPDEGDTLGRYLYDIRMLEKDDKNVRNLYIMDIDFLIFYKKLETVSEDLSYKIDVRCPVCGKVISKTLEFNKDIHFKQIDPKIMNGARIELNGHHYDTIVPTLTEFMKVFDIYLRYKKITDLSMIKTIALIKDFEGQANQVEDDVLHAKHEDITLLMALRDLYYDRSEPITVYCPDCNEEGGGKVVVSSETLITDFFRSLYINSPIDGTKVLFK